MEITVKTTRSNPGWMDKLKRTFAEQTGKEVAVGFPKGEAGVGNPHYDSGASILEVAIYNNFGTERGIPPRPFMNNAEPALNEMWARLSKEAQPKINSGAISEETVMKAAGLQGETLVRKAIDELMEPPNSPKTVLRKKSAKPLIDSGDMRKYVTSVTRSK